MCFRFVLKSLVLSSERTASLVLSVQSERTTWSLVKPGRQTKLIAVDLAVTWQSGCEATVISLS